MADRRDRGFKDNSSNHVSGLSSALSAAYSTFSSRRCVSFLGAAAALSSHSARDRPQLAALASMFATLWSVQVGSSAFSGC